MPEVAAAVKRVVSHKASKRSSTKVSKKLPKKWRKSRKQSYSTYVYRGLTHVHPSTRCLSKAMSVMNSFVVNIFKRIAPKASHLIRYNKRHTILAKKIQHAIRLKLAKHTISKGTNTVTKYTNSI
ncbi:histone H2B-like [Carcharodon carcharias]|uniref:histone H2B-like n=1 Tax=Carcharodon carcharias TaxID=13397 RepID=UPI001B7EA507|nr:histone H2B-like [Carcharodon carcharias]